VCSHVCGAQRTAAAVLHAVNADHDTRRWWQHHHGRTHFCRGCIKHRLHAWLHCNSCSPPGGVKLAVRSLTGPGTMPPLHWSWSSPVVSSPLTGVLSPNGLRDLTSQAYLLLAFRPVTFSDRPSTSCPNTLQKKEGVAVGSRQMVSHNEDVG
jgi:hypothetical protein